MIWILFTLLSIIFFTVGFLMLRRLKLYFKDFYKQFGGKLWFANVVLTLPLLFRAIFDALMNIKAWKEFWTGAHANPARDAFYNMLIIGLGTYVPLIF